MAPNRSPKHSQGRHIVAGFCLPPQIPTEYSDSSTLDGMNHKKILAYWLVGYTPEV